MKMTLKKICRKFGSKKKKQQRKKENITIDRVMHELDCNRFTAKNQLSKAKGVGVGSDAYVKYHAWMLSDEEIWELGIELKLERHKLFNTKQWMIDVVCEKTGWNRYSAYQSMEKALKNGYTYRRYITNALFAKPESEWGECEQKKHNAPKSKSGQLAKSDLRRKKIMEEMGWNEAQFQLDYLKARNNCGCSLYDYTANKLYLKSRSEQRNYITEALYIRLQLRRCDFVNGYTYLNNKALFERKFSEYIFRKSFSNEGISFEEFEERIKGLEEIFVKPIEGIGGKGICKCKVNESEDKNRSVFSRIMDTPSIIEEAIVQNEELSNLNSSSINTIRVFTMNIDGKVEILSPVLRIGNGGIVDNFHSGGMVAAIDKKTGTIVTHAKDGQGNIYEEHPISHVKIMGFKVPCWDKILDSCEKVAKVIPEMQYVGWDFCVNKRGEVDLIEGNHNPMTLLPQIAFSTLDKGAADDLWNYIYFDK